MCSNPRRSHQRALPTLQRFALALTLSFGLHQGLLQAADRPVQSAANIGASTADSDRLTRLAVQMTEPAAHAGTAAPSTPKPNTPPSAAVEADPTSGPQALPDIEKRVLGRARPNPDDLRSPVAAAHQASSDQGWMLNTLAALGAVIGLILFLRTVLARTMGRGSSAGQSPAIEVLTRTTVAPKNHVLLLRVGRRVLVVGDSAAGLRTLADLTDPEEVAGILTSIAVAKPASVSQSFAHVFGGMNREYREEERTAQEGADDQEHKVDHAHDEVSGLLSRLRAARRGGQE